MIYQSTPDYYRDVIQHGWLKDTANKAHKYIERWKGKNGKWYYRYKNRAQGAILKTRRKILGLDPEDITNAGAFGKIDPKIKNHITISTLDGKVIRSFNKSNYDNRRDYGRADSRSGSAGAGKIGNGITAGRKRSKTYRNIQAARKAQMNRRAK